MSLDPAVKGHNEGFRLFTLSVSLNLSFLGTHPLSLSQPMPIASRPVLHTIKCVYVRWHKAASLSSPPPFSISHRHATSALLNLILSFHSLVLLGWTHGGLSQTRPADRAGAEKHCQPPPNQLYQSHHRSGQRVRVGTVSANTCMFF